MSAEGRAFVDTNVLVYLLGDDTRKADIAESILLSRRIERVVSTQVVSEFVHTARRKARLRWPEIRFQVESIREACWIEQIFDEDQDNAFEIASEYRFGWYDSLIVATALRSRAPVLLSEDLQDGRRIESLTVSNPFSSRYTAY